MNTVTASSETTTQPETTAHKRGCLFTIKRVLKWFGIALVTLIVLGVVFQAVAVELDKRNYAPRGQFYTVNGHQMHIICKGKGSPVVILQAGATAESLWWYRVQNQLAEHTRVCAYDRPGMGWSEPVSGSRDPTTINGELHTLLEQAGVSAPYIVVGHSYGSILTRIFAAQYPDEVVGAVLVDSQLVTPKHFASQSEIDQNRSYWDVVQAVSSAMTRLVQSNQFQTWGYPPELAPEMNGLQARNQVIDAYYAENGPAFPALQEASASAENLGDIPMAVLWASQTITAYDTHIEGFRELRQEISTYSTNSVTRTIEGADHGSILGNEQYAQQVSNAILDVIKAAQTGEPLAQ
jgi:pimeloyl-ACP methyl ester carboxylesterase